MTSPLGAVLPADHGPGEQPRLLPEVLQLPPVRCRRHRPPRAGLQTQRPGPALLTAAHLSGLTLLLVDS